MRDILISIALGAGLLLSACSAVSTSDASDAAISRIASTGIRGYDINVEMPRPSRAIVTGTVRSEADRLRVINAIKEDPAITTVDDQLTLKRAQMTAPELEALRKQILAEVSAYPLIGTLRLELFIDSKRQLSIKGQAPSEALVKRIKETAEKLYGSPAEVAISVPPPASDATVRARILEALNSDASIDSSRFRLQVQNGVATVIGHFPRHDEIDRILAIVLMVDGVRDIRFEDTGR